MHLHRYPCPCCRYLTLAEEPPGTYEIRPICGWEDENVQIDDPTYAGGANKTSLATARASFDKIGAADPKLLGQVRAPTPSEIRSRAARHDKPR